MPTIGEFIFDLAFGKADTKNLDDAERDAKKVARDVRKEWKEAGKAIAGAFKVAAASIVGATTGIVALTERTSAHAAELSRWSTTLGVTTKELQRLEFAGSKVGAETDNMREAVKTLRENLGELQRVGTGPAVDSLKTLGLRLEDLVDLPAEEQVARLSDAFQGLPNQAQRISVALELMGEDGRALLPLFAQGSAAIRGYGDEAEKLGVVLGDDVVAASVKVQQDLTSLKATLGGLVASIAGDAMPVVQEWLGELQIWISNDRELVRERVREFVAALIPLLQSTAKLVATVAVNVAKLTEVLGPEGLVVAVGGAQVALAALRGGFIGLLPHIAAVTAAVLAGTAAINGFADAKIKALQTKVEAGNQELETRKARDRKRLQGETDAQLRQRVRELEGSGAQKFVQDILDERQQIQGTLTGTLDSVNAQANAQIADQQAVQAGLASSLGIVNGRRRGRGGGGGGGGRQRPQEFKTDAMSRKADELFGEEIRMLAEKGGVGEIAIKAALGSATESLQTGAAERVARQAALKRLGGLTGQDLGGTEVDNSPLSQIFNGENVPDVELSSLARGAKPQTLVSTINNTFNFDVTQEISGAGEPGEVARNAITSLRDMFQEGLERSTRTAKVVYAR